jgi:putative PIN family toxin of toxin-antitoxin system
MRYARRAPLAPRAVLDSSVLVSAFITPRGSVVRLLHAPARDRYELCLSQFILTETAETLLSKPRLRQYAAYADRDVHDFIRWLLTQAEIVRDIPELRVVADDPKDDPIIATAVAAGAGYLVTGDRAHLLPIGRYEGIRIVSPRAFLEILR